jgi:hypothetical protein
LAQIISVVTTYSFKISMVAAGAIAFVGSLSLGVTIAIHQARQAMRKEAQVRMQHILNCFETNKLRRENLKEFNTIVAMQLETTTAGETRFNQLVSYVEGAGLACPFELVLKSCRSITQERDFSSMRRMLKKVQRLNQLTLNLLDHVEQIDGHYINLHERFQSAKNARERTKIANELLNMEYMLNYLDPYRGSHIPFITNDRISSNPLPAHTNMKARLKTMFLEPLQRFVHLLPHQSYGFQSALQAVGAGLLFTAAVISMAMLFTAVVQTLVIVGACAVFVGAILGAICYGRAQREKRCEAVTQRSEAVKTRYPG